MKFEIQPYHEGYSLRGFVGDQIIVSGVFSSEADAYMACACVKMHVSYAGTMPSHVAEPAVERKKLPAWSRAERIKYE